MLSLLSLTSFLFTSNAIPCDVGEELYKCWDNNGAFELEYDQNCTYMDWICDEIADCPFGDDEWNCPTYEQCMTDTDNTGAPIGFGCDNTTCIYYSWSCLGGDVSVWDCPNQADVSQQTCQEVAGYTGKGIQYISVHHLTLYARVYVLDFDKKLQITDNLLFYILVQYN